MGECVSPLDASPARLARSTNPADAPPVSGAATRVAWIDYARGLAIILVVYGHCFRGLQDGGLVGAGSPLPVIDFIIYGFHMPLFFFLSGAVSTKAFGQDVATFLRGRLLTLGWPYLVWMSIEAALLLGLSGLTNMGPPMLSVSTYLYRPLSPFWFLYALFAASLVIYAIRRCTPSVRLVVAAGLYAGGQFVPVDIIQLSSWGLFYLCLGNCTAHWIRRPDVIARLSAPGTLIVAALATVSISIGMLDLGCPYRFEVPVAIAGSIAVFGCAQRLAQAGRTVAALRLLAVLGQISLTVLVVHVLGTAGMRIALTKGLHLHLLWLHLLAGTAAGLALPLCLQIASERLGLVRALGLPTRPAMRLQG